MSTMGQNLSTPTEVDIESGDECTQARSPNFLHSSYASPASSRGMLRLYSSPDPSTPPKTKICERICDQIHATDETFAYYMFLNDDGNSVGKRCLKCRRYESLGKKIERVHENRRRMHGRSIKDYMLSTEQAEVLRDEVLERQRAWERLLKTKGIDITPEETESGEYRRPIPVA